MVVYSNELKEQLLGIDSDLLARYGAVSAETAQAMASQAAQRLGCDIAVSATGIAGPEGGTAEKPVGTVYLGLWYQDTVVMTGCAGSTAPGGRFRRKPRKQLDMVRRALLES